MTTLTAETQIAKAQQVAVTDDSLTVDLTDGRTLSVPLAWYPRLLHGTPKERNHWRLIGDGEGIHWPDLDENISVEGLIFGRPSGESQRSFKRWLDRHARRSVRSKDRLRSTPAARIKALSSKRAQLAAPRRRITKTLAGSRRSRRVHGD